MINSAVMIGNGINRVMNSDAWGEMIEELSSRCGCDALDDKCDSNLLLEFERIYYSAVNAGKVKTKYDVKKVFASLIPEATDLNLQQRLTNLPVENFVTTNYDYYLEKSVVSDYNRKKSGSLTSEKKHSLYRKTTVDGRYIWHIHGEQHTPASICLGYEHYCSYLATMHTLLTKPREDVSKMPYIKYFMENQPAEILTWMTLFFTHDVYIVGLALSFIEIDLWWLLNYRAQFFIENAQYRKPKIHYYFPVKDESELHDQLVMLDALDVDLYPMMIRGRHWGKYYQDIISDIEHTIKI